MQANIFAYTAPGADFPEYISINRQDDSRITIAVRSPVKDGLPGTLAEMTLPVDAVNALIVALDVACPPFLPDLQ